MKPPARSPISASRSSTVARTPRRPSSQAAASPQKPPPITATWGREAPAIALLLIETNFPFPEVCVGAVLVEEALAGVDAGNGVVGKLVHGDTPLG